MGGRLCARVCGNVPESSETAPPPPPDIDFGEESNSNDISDISILKVEE
jgi:hypothetical protein